MLVAIEQALSDENWYAALALALTLPDICGRIQNPGLTSRKRYISWYDTYLLKKYLYKGSGDFPDMLYLSGSDCYALRCAFLHSGSGDISYQDATQVLQRVEFHIPDPTSPAQVSLIYTPECLTVNIEMFCRDFIAAVREWLKSNPVVPFADFLHIGIMGTGRGVGVRISSTSGVIDLDEEQRAVIPQAGE